MQTRIDRQRTQPRSPRAQHPTPAVAYPAQDGELLLVQAADRGRRTDVAQRLRERAFGHRVSTGRR